MASLVMWDSTKNRKEGMAMTFEWEADKVV